MEYTAKAKKFFENNKNLKQYSAYAPYLSHFYKQVLATCPDYADEIINRFGNIKVHVEDISAKGQPHDVMYGDTWRFLVGDKPYASINLVKSELGSVERTDYIRKETFFHEMLHAIAGYKDIKVNNPLIKPTDRCVKYGNTSIIAYPQGYKKGDTVVRFFQYDLLEEGIVEDWAVDILTASGFTRDYVAKNKRVDLQTYQIATTFCSLWNLATDNQLRKEFVSGVGDDSAKSRATDTFRKKAGELFLALNWSQTAHGAQPSSFNVNKIVALYTDLTKYCVNNCAVSKLSPEQRAKFDQNIEYLRSGEPLMKIIDRMCSNKDPKALQAVKNQTLSLVQKQDFNFQEKQDKAQSEKILQEYKTGNRGKKRGIIERIKDFIHRVLG